jgi:hypothetical protein
MPGSLQGSFAMIWQPFWISMPMFGNFVSRKIWVYNAIFALI